MSEQKHVYVVDERNHLHRLTSLQYRKLLEFIVASPEEHPSIDLATFKATAMHAVPVYLDALTPEQAKRQIKGRPIS